jgi:hypothetical protein
VAGNHPADAAGDLPHPDPLHTRGVRRSGRGEHEHPAEGPANARMRLLAPRRGAVCPGEGSGTLFHVDHPHLAIRVFGRPPDPHHEIRRPCGPSRLVQGRSTGPLFLINVGDTLLPRRGVRDSRGGRVVGELSLHHPSRVVSFGPTLRVWPAGRWKRAPLWRFALSTVRTRVKSRLL